jgi:cytochrome c553
MTFAKTLWILRVAPAVLAVAQSGQPETQPPSFESDVKPILTTNCTGCHGTATRIKEMNLSTLDGVMKGSESGPVVFPGRPDDSKLYQMVREGKMPPGKKHLSEPALATIRSWIESLQAPSIKTTGALSENVTEHGVIPIMYLRCTVCHGLRRREGCTT